MVNFLHLTQLVSGALLVLFILLHSPKGDGLASIGGASQMFSSQKGVEAGLNRITTIAAVIFLVSSLLIGTGLVK